MLISLANHRSFALVPRLSWWFSGPLPARVCRPTRASTVVAIVLAHGAMSQVSMWHCASGEGGLGLRRSAPWTMHRLCATCLQAKPRSDAGSSLDNIDPLDVNMEDLEILECAITAVGKSPPRGVKREASPESRTAPSDASPVASTSCKKRRPSRFRPSSSLRDPSPDDSAADSTLQAGEIKTCMGCARTQHGPCYINIGEVVPWAFTDGRGNLCRDCHGLWRLLYNAHGLNMFGKHLAHPMERQTWEWDFIAFVSLRIEGIERLTASMVMQRADMRSRICNLMCVPKTPYTICLLTDWLNDQKTQDAPAPESLVSIGLGDTSVLGVMAPTTAAKFVEPTTRPQTSTTGCLASRALMKLDEESRLLLAKLYPGLGRAALPADRTASAAAPSHTTGAQFGTDKLMTKLLVHIGAAKSLLDAFERPTWPDIAMEGTFSKPINAINAMKLEAQAAGHSGVFDLAGTWLGGLQQAKMFTKKYKDSALEEAK